MGTYDEKGCSNEKVMEDESVTQKMTEKTR